MVIASFGVILNGVATIIYLAIDDFTPWFSLVWLGTEAIPILIIMITLWPRKGRGGSGSGSSTATGSGTGTPTWMTSATHESRSFA